MESISTPSPPSATSTAEESTHFSSALLFSIVVGVCRKNGGIGFKNNLPWPYISRDMKWFSKITSTLPSQTSRPKMPQHVLFQSGLQDLYESIMAEEQKSNDVNEFDPEGIKPMNAVIMGRKTWESIPKPPLPSRINVVVTSQQSLQADTTKWPVITAGSLEKALDLLDSDYRSKNKLGEVFVIGGAGLFDQLFQKEELKQRLKSVYLTRIGGEFESDRFFKYELDSDYSTCYVSKTFYHKSGFNYDFTVLVRRSLFQREARMKKAMFENPLYSLIPRENLEIHGPHQEQQYLGLIREIMRTGTQRANRTGTDTLSLFGKSMRFDLSEGRFPLLTTKNVFWRGVAQELLWFLRGETSSLTLHNKKVKIWDANGSRQFLDSLGLKEREEGDLGPVYGFQWRHFGAQYGTMHDDYSDNGVDQIRSVLRDLMGNPDTRRIILSAWNPSAQPKMALPPCHILSHFYVLNGTLSCQMYQRSADMGLGVPFNIASYALLTYLLAYVSGLRPGQFIHVIGDAHIYVNHIEPLKEQLKRVPNPFPTLKIKKEFTQEEGMSLDKRVEAAIKYLESMEVKDLGIEGYEAHGKINMKMAV